MRHGQSIANQKGLIVSAPENGVSDYGLSDEGRVQVERSIRVIPESVRITQIISSDFKRARESAEIGHQILGGKHEIIFEKSLRERFFGDFELKPNNHYQTVWDDDTVSSAHTKNNVESADTVMKRATSLVLSLEKDFNGESFLLVSHGDTLQILHTAFQKQDASRHRGIPHLETAEIRELILA